MANKERPEERVNLMFLDSGAHSLYNAHVAEQGGGRKADPLEKKKLYKFYETPEFFQYVDAYCAYVKENMHAIDYYVNVDAIFNPEITWKVQKYIENEHGLKPVPVIHHGTPYKWVEKYLEDGHDLIGLGGMGQGVDSGSYLRWADEVYYNLCPASNDFKPIVKTHGFAMTAYRLLRRYPWWSVDSASWVKSGGFGMLYVPRQTRGKFDFSKDPFSISISATPPNAEKEENIERLKRVNRGAFLSKKRLHHPAIVGGKSFHTQPKVIRNAILDWLNFVDIPLGSVDENGQCVEKGVMSHHSSRKIANLHFFHAMQESLDPWPWAFKPNRPVMRGFF